MNINKTGKVFTSKFVGTGPSSYKKKKNLLGRGLMKVENRWFRLNAIPALRNACQPIGHAE
jgi:hypothetical protein